jgi:hypothetical protein
MTNLEKFHTLMDDMELGVRAREVFSAVFIGALSALLTSDEEMAKWERALRTASEYPMAEGKPWRAKNNSEGVQYIEHAAGDVQHIEHALTVRETVGEMVDRVQGAAR